MKNALLLLSAVSVALTACDGEKAQEAAAKTKEAASAIGAASKEAAAKAKDATQGLAAKAKDLAHTTAEKTKDLAAHANQAIKDSGVVDKAKAAGVALGAKAKDMVANLSEEHKASVASLKGKLGDFSKWVQSKRNATSAADAKPALQEMVGQLKALDTTALPGDLKSAVEGFKAHASAPG
jgi:hypothetical protein